MDLKRQASAPLYEAIEKFRKKRIVPFDVPGHKRGRGNPELVDLLGERCVGIDVNSMKPLDNLCHPVSVIKEAEELTAEAFGAEHAFFMVGGTTQAVQNMVLSVCKAGGIRNSLCVYSRLLRPDGRQAPGADGRLQGRSSDHKISPGYRASRYCRSVQGR